MENKNQIVQNFINRGCQILEHGNLCLAMEMFEKALELAPSCIEARRMLRTAQIADFKKNPVCEFILYYRGLIDIFTRKNVESLIAKGKCFEAMAEAEKLMRDNPLLPANIECAVKAANAAGLPEVAALTIEAAYSCSKNDANLLERIAQYYTIAKKYDKARDVYQKLLQLKPGDQRIIQLLKNAEARNTMSGEWETAVGKQGGFQKLLKDRDAVESMNRAGLAVVSGDNVDSAINEKLKQIEQDPGNMNTYRALARIYISSKRYDDAIDIIKKSQAVSQADPELDRMLATITISKYDRDIDMLKKEGKTEEAEALQVEKDQFVFDDLYARTQRYPNDLRLRFELGYQYYMRGETDSSLYDEAIQNLQLAQKSPRDRLAALYYLAMCFIKKDQTDMAVMQLESAMDQMPQMDDLKKKVIYQLGICAESAGDIDKAYEYYKEVYTHDITFMDLTERMTKIRKIKNEKSAS